MRGELAHQVSIATDREKAEQDWLRKTDDWKEGVKAMAERRPPNFRAK
jgi:enoyl-CoA hydratase/carnithine racemase